MVERKSHESAARAAISQSSDRVSRCETFTLDPANLAAERRARGARSCHRFYEQYRIAWYCDGRAAGRLEVRLTDGKWQVVGHGQTADWEAAVSELGLDAAPDCTRAYLTKYGLGDWVVLTDEIKGVLAHSLSSNVRVAAGRLSGLHRQHAHAGTTPRPYSSKPRRRSPRQRVFTNAAPRSGLQPQCTY
jgi:hypothetical protein